MDECLEMYVQRLDAWYYSVMKEKFTPEFDVEIEQVIRTGAENNPVLQIMLGNKRVCEVIEKSVKEYSSGVFVEWHKNFFSGAYKSLEHALNEGCEDCSCRALYFLELLQGWVKKVRLYGMLAENVPDKVIVRSFVEQYKKPERITDFLDAVLLFADLLAGVDEQRFGLTDQEDAILEVLVLSPWKYAHSFFLGEVLANPCEELPE